MPGTFSHPSYFIIDSAVPRGLAALTDLDYCHGQSSFGPFDMVAVAVVVAAVVAAVAAACHVQTDLTADDWPDPSWQSL